MTKVYVLMDTSNPGYLYGVFSTQGKAEAWMTENRPFDTDGDYTIWEEVVD